MTKPPQSVALSCWLDRGNLMEHPCCPLTACCCSHCSHRHPHQSMHGCVSCGPERKVRWDEKSGETKSLVRRKVGTWIYQFPLSAITLLSHFSVPIQAEILRRCPRRNQSKYSWGSLSYLAWPLSCPTVAAHFIHDPNDHHGVELTGLGVDLM